MSDQPKPSVIASMTVETDSETISKIEQAIGALGLTADQTTPAMIFLVGFRAGQAGWSEAKIMEYVKPIAAAGRADAIARMMQMAKSRAAGES